MYNGKTGKSNDTAIIIYVITGAVLGLGLGTCLIALVILGNIR